MPAEEGRGRGYRGSARPSSLNGPATLLLLHKGWGHAGLISGGHSTWLHRAQAEAQKR